MINRRVINCNRIICVLCIAAVTLITLFTTAYAHNPFNPDMLDDDYDYSVCTGIKPISLEVAQNAAYDIYGNKLGIDKEQLNGMLCFVKDTAGNRVVVYSVEYDDPVDYIMYKSDVQIYSVAFDTSITSTYIEKTLQIRDIYKSTDVGFAVLTKSFNFLAVNPICSMIIGLSFTFFSFRLISYGIKTAKAI